jgi:hypothetical protein
LISISFFMRSLSSSFAALAATVFG